MSRSLQCSHVVVVLRSAPVAVARSVDVALRPAAMITSPCPKVYNFIGVYCRIVGLSKKASRPIYLDCFSLLLCEYFR